MRKKVMLLLMFVLFITVIHAQGTRVSLENPVVVTEINSYLETTASKVAGVPNSTLINVQNIKSLTTEVQPSIYFYSGVAKIYGDKPKNLFTDVNSLSQLDNAIALKNNIEIIIIKIDNIGQLNSTIDLGLFSNFKNLKYFYIISSVTTTQDAIAAMITNYNEKYSIFYKIYKGDTNQ